MLSYEQRQRKAKEHDRIYKSDEQYEEIWGEPKYSFSYEEFEKSHNDTEMQQKWLPLSSQKKLQFNEEDKSFTEFIASAKASAKPRKYKFAYRKLSNYIPRDEYAKLTGKKVRPDKPNYNPSDYINLDA